MQQEPTLRVNLTREEIEFICRFCTRAIALVSRIKDDMKIFDQEAGDNLEKAQHLSNKMQSALEIFVKLEK